MAGGGEDKDEARMPREMEIEGESSKTMEQQSGDPSCDLEILRREITSLMILLTDKQSDVLCCDSEILKKITSLKSEITSLKLARKRKGLVPPPDVSPTVRRKISSVRRIVEEKEDMADQEMVDLSNSSGHKDTDSRKIKPTSRFKSNFEQECVSCGGRHDAKEPVECQFDYILHDTEATSNQLASLASILRESSSPIISLDKIKDLMDTTYCLFRVSSGIAEDFMKSENLMTKEMVRQTDSKFRLGAMEEEKTEGEVEDLKTSDLKREETSDEDEDEVVEKTLEEKEFDDNLYKVLEQVNKETLYYRMQMASLEEKGENDDDDDDDDEEEEEEELMEIEFTESDKEEMDMEERMFASHQSGWESTWGSKTVARNFFKDQTIVSPMYFTHSTPGHVPSYPTAFTGSTLQIYTIKIQTKGKLSWPLYVYGVVAARDSVDRNRNILFCRTRFNCQKLTQEDPFLHLTGPSRAIIMEDPVGFEFQLKLKGRVESEDRVLMNQTYHYRGGYPWGLYTASLGNRFCTAELNVEQLIDTVQATILGVCIGEGDPLSLFKYGGRVSCFSPPQELMKADMHATDTACRQVVLLDFRGVKMPIGADGYLQLSRNVVSVDFQEKPGCSREYAENLEVVIQAYSDSGSVAAEGRVKFMPKKSNISQGACYLVDSKVEIVVAWSALVSSRIHIVDRD